MPTDRLCLEQLGFDSRFLGSHGVDEVRPYVGREMLTGASLDEKSWRLTRLYRTNTGNLWVPHYAFLQELDILGSIEQPVALEELHPPLLPQAQATGRGLICSCYNRKQINATVRKSVGSGLYNYIQNINVAPIKTKIA